MRCFVVAVLITCLCPLGLRAQPAATPEVPPAPKGKPGSWRQMDYGPVIAHTVHAKWPEKNTAAKGQAIRLIDPKSKKQAVIVYDTDLMRVAAASIAPEEGAFLDLSKTNHTSYKGGDNAHLEGTQVFGTAMVPGWANPEDGSLKDPRAFPGGPLPKSWVHFKGFYKHGEQVVLRYTVGDCEVLELPGVEVIDEIVFVTRTIEIGKSSRDLTMLIADTKVWDNGSFGMVTDSLHMLVGVSAKKQGGLDVPVDHDDPVFVAAARSKPVRDWDFAHERKTDERLDRVTMKIAANQTPAKIKILIWEGVYGNIKDKKGADFGDRVIKAVASAKPLSPLGDMIHGGPPRWKDIVQTKGTISTAKSAYVVDTLTVPEQNPWNSWMRLVGFDFFADAPGSKSTKAAVSTWNGDVWIVSGIDDKLDKLTWKRFASGLYEPLGLVVKNDQVYALGYDRITRLHDLNGDGEADYYENFHSDWIAHPRAYPLCLSVDSQGNFYTIANGNRAEKVPQHGCIHRVSADGSKLEVFATGLRSANGLGIASDDRVAIADQEGNWTPASRIDLVKRGDFIGYQPHADPLKPTAGAAASAAQRPYKPPLCWLPKNIDNSAGDLIWAPNDPQSRWGPLKGHLLATSYGMCKLFLVPYEEVNGAEQGGVVAFPFTFSSGVMRVRFNPRDGQLYLAGLKGWQTRAAFDAGFFRVRYTGANSVGVHMPVAIHPTKAGVTLTFTSPLDAETASDPSSYEVLRWNYVYSEKYGSPEFSVADPKKQGRDAVKVKSAALSKDGKTVRLELDDMKPVMQMMVKLNVESAEGDPVKLEVHHTVHHLSDK